MHVERQTVEFPAAPPSAAPSRMRPLLPLAIGLLVIALPTGCRQNPYTDIYLDAMRAEYRMLEDQFYEVEADYQAKLAELDSLRQENARLRGGTSARPASGRSDTGPLDVPDVGDTPDLTPPRVDPGELTPPSIEVPGGAPDGELPGLDPAGVDPLQNPPNRSTEAASSPDRSARAVLPGRVTSLFVDPQRTRGENTDGHQGDEGLVVVFQPRDGNRQFVPRAGAVSIVAINPADRTRVGRWEFTAAQVQDARQTGNASAGFHLRCPWPGAAPAHDAVSLFVRYHRGDGTHLQTRYDFKIHLDRLAVDNWTPRNAAPSSAPSTQPRVARQSDSAPTEGASPSSPAPPRAIDAPAPPEWTPFR